MKKWLIALVLCLSGCIGSTPCEQPGVIGNDVSQENEEPSQCLDCNFDCLLPCKQACAKDLNKTACEDSCRSQCCYGIANN